MNEKNVTNKVWTSYRVHILDQIGNVGGRVYNQAWDHIHNQIQDQIYFEWIQGQVSVQVKDGIK